MSIVAPKRRSGVRVRDDAGAALPQRPYLNAGTNLSATDDGTQIILNAAGGSGGGSGTNLGGTYIEPLGPGQDDSPQLQAALNSIDASNGGTLYIKGVLRLKTRCNYVGQGLVIKGVGGWRNSGLAPFDASYLGMDLLYIGDENVSVWNRVEGLWFGSLNGQKTGGTALIFNSSYSHVENCLFESQFHCIQITDGSQIHFIQRCWFWNFAGHGVYCQITGPTFGDLTTPRGNEYQIKDCWFWGAPHAVGSGYAGIYWATGDPLNVVNCEIMMCDVGIKVVPVNVSSFSQPNHWCWLDNLIIDECKSYGIQMDTSGGGGISHVYATNTYLHNSYNPTVWKGWSFVGGGSGIDDVQIVGGTIGGGVASLWFGAAANVRDIHIDGVSLTRDAKFAAGQTYDNITMENIRLSPNVNCDLGGANFTNSRFENFTFDPTGGATGSFTNTSGLLSSTSRTSKVGGHIGWRPTATIPSVPASTSALSNPNPFDCSVYITGGTVAAVAVNGVTTGMTSGNFHVGQGQTITLTYSSAPTWTWIAKT